ncbi:EAL domain-containing protein [Enterovibrio paralichthyis]|uniref:bifunctional diguanylate cyclase/phosphodiesterase n=1 Tax=Enterovibrio paralichthyis TaxID=2853805 RepID=UPI001C486158|nr:EAL domain-containing protein [Enterovibrio paralichthyis]MBV7299107.1 EAL domain-containing protein [Enterovibrio paralichthyis]
MTVTEIRKGSLFTHLAVLVCAAVIAVFTVSSALIYIEQRNELLDRQQESVSESAERLTRTVAPFISAYSINEYENLIKAELNLKGFHAILVKDDLMGKVLGKKHYITGHIRLPNGETKRYVEGRAHHEELLSQAQLAASPTVTDSNGAPIGSVSIFVTDEAITQSLGHLLRQTLATSVITALILISLLLFFAKRFFTSPLEQITSAIGLRDISGIPISHIPEFPNRELSTLSHTMNAMIDMIRHSHHTVKMEHARLHNVIESTQSGTWEWDVETGKITYNGAWMDILGYDAETLNGPPNQDWKQFIHPEDKMKSDAELELLFGKQVSFYDCELRLRHWSGQWLHVLARGKVVEWDHQYRPLKILGTLQNITAHKQAEDNLRLAAKVFTHAREGIIIADAHSRIIEVNDAFCRITGYTLEDVKGKNPSILRSGKQNKSFYKDMWASLQKRGHWSGEIWNRRKTGETYAELLTISVVTDNEGVPQNYVAVFSDITAYKEHEHKLQKIAHFDPLTELPNRLLLLDRLKHAMKLAKRHQHYIAVIFLDLDGFKPVNDNFGHDVGDVLLQQLAKRMKYALRECDTIARIGGDEFVAVLSDLPSPEACQPLLPRLLDAACEPVDVGGNVVQVSASFGITTYPQNDEVDSDKLLRQADYAMYQAKLKGKKRYHFFDAELERSLKTQNENLQRIGEALRQNQFFLLYQPKVNLRTGEIIGVEALIRWQHPEQGLLSPNEFIPHIENHSLISDIGNWVIEESLSQLTKWQEQGLNTSVSVNISPYHLLQQDFIDKLRVKLARYPHIEPSQLELEILETSAFEDIDAVSKVIERGKKMGLLFAIDDFGTGYASLTYLKRLSAQTLKIDRSFVRDMLEDKDDLTILEGVITLANTFGREVVAEGVETHEQIELLLWLGCDLGQGFGISRPIPPDDIIPWTKRWKPDPKWHASADIQERLRPLLETIVENRARIERFRNYIDLK